MSGHNSREQLMESQYAYTEDPGDGGEIKVIRNLTVCHLVSSAAETRTLIDPSAAGIRLTLVFRTDGGDIDVTASTAINRTGNTVMEFENIHEFIDLVSVEDGDDSYRWRALASDVTLS